jgi:hypothetical protein
MSDVSRRLAAIRRAPVPGRREENEGNDPEASRWAGEHPDPRGDTGPPGNRPLVQPAPAPAGNPAGAPGSWSGVDAAAVTGAWGTLPCRERGEAGEGGDDHRKGETTADMADAGLQQTRWHVHP